MMENSMKKLTHIDDQGKSQMVDISARQITERVATVSGRVYFSKEVHELIVSNKVSKGNVIETARIASIMATKKTSELIPLCHPLSITGSDISITLEDDGVLIFATIKTTDRTGVEMEAFTAVAVAALTVVDMIKAVDAHAYIGKIQLEYKNGGKNGEWHRTST